jgi:hypothetical protein
MNQRSVFSKTRRQLRLDLALALSRLRPPKLGGQLAEPHVGEYDPAEGESEIKQRFSCGDGS